MSMLELLLQAELRRESQLNALSNVQDDAADAQWFDVASPPQPLAFDHKEVVRKAFEHLLVRPDGQKKGKHSTTQFNGFSWKL